MNSTRSWFRILKKLETLIYVRCSGLLSLRAKRTCLNKDLTIWKKNIKYKETSVSSSQTRLKLKRPRHKNLKINRSASNYSLMRSATCSCKKSISWRRTTNNLRSLSQRLNVNLKAQIEPTRKQKDVYLASRSLRRGDSRLRLYCRTIS